MEESADGPWLSVVIPTLREAAALGNLLSDLRGLPGGYEVVVVDGGSDDGTREIAAGFGARIVESPPGRGVQLAAGARAARAERLCFLHADVRLDDAALRAIVSAALADDGAAYVLRLRIAGRGWAYRAIERAANARSRLLRLPYGDQGLVVARDTYERAGGHPSIPLMEDVELARAFGRVGVSIRLLEAAATVSARRWEREGPLRRSGRNLILLCRYLSGADPTDLAGSYRPEGVEG